MIALQIARLVVHKFVAGEKPLTAASIAAELDQPLRLSHRVLGELVESGVLNEVLLEKAVTPTYVPARDVDQFTISFILEALEARGVNDLPLLEGEDASALARALAQLRESLRQSPGNRSLKEL
jgi:DNA-binding IscR family transcriptional regulator